MNQIIIIGNVGNEPELRYTKNGKEQITFSVADNQSYVKDGVWKEDVNWHNCIAFGKVAVRINNEINKGDKVFVSGKEKERRWKNKAGYEQRQKEVVVGKVYYLGVKKNASFKHNGELAEDYIEDEGTEDYMEEDNVPGMDENVDKEVEVSAGKGKKAGK